MSLTGGIRYVMEGNQALMSMKFGALSLMIQNPFGCNRSSRVGLKIRASGQWLSATTRGARGRSYAFDFSSKWNVEWEQGAHSTFGTNPGTRSGYTRMSARRALYSQSS
ncbi:hypothetical protein Salat_2346300 [Sesamum alatum]|uniref:Uncharacterized protein n=1 Tax=Sesamum alatum TaxID=300844 RepID=A0AAE1XWM8_9LAMI|nr:hypothetical protein Salat_2346300 [Sesamum alatum]